MQARVPLQVRREGSGPPHRTMRGAFRAPWRRNAWDSRLPDDADSPRDMVRDGPRDSPRDSPRGPSRDRPCDVPRGFRRASVLPFPRPSTSPFHQSQLADARHAPRRQPCPFPNRLQPASRQLDGCRLRRSPNHRAGRRIASFRRRGRMPASARSDPPSDAAHSPMRPGASADSCRFCRKKVRWLGSSCVRPKPQRTPIGGHHSWRRRGPRSSRGPRSGLEERQRRRRCHGRSATRFRPMAGAPACRRDERLLVMDACRRELPARTPGANSRRELPRVRQIVRVPLGEKPIPRSVRHPERRQCPREPTRLPEPPEKAPTGPKTCRRVHASDGMRPVESRFAECRTNGSARRDDIEIGAGDPLVAEPDADDLPSDRRREDRVELIGARTR